MKSTAAFIAGLAGAALAAPQGSLSNELSGPCKKVTLVYARASTETNNMGLANSVGPGLCKGLKSAFSNDVACQGVSAPAYSAGLMDNVSVKGTTSSAIQEATKHFTTAASKCPNTIMVTGGYSQGTAVIFNTVSALPANVKSRVAGAVLYGYTKNAQNKGIIPNYPSENVKTFCPKADGVCNGALNVNTGHFSYLANGDIPAGTQFLVSKIKAFRGGAASSGGGEEAPAAAGGEAAAPKAAKGGKGLGGLGKGKSAPPPDSRVPLPWDEE